MRGLECECRGLGSSRKFRVTQVTSEAILVSFSHHSVLHASSLLAAHAGRFSRGRGSIFLDNVNCSGTELQLTDCRNRGVGVHYCGHYEDAGVVCIGKLAILIKRTTHHVLGQITLVQSRLPHTDCEDGEILCPLGRIGRSGRIDTFGERCINESFVCDGVQDCAGGTDEVNCGHGKTFINCYDAN